MNTDFSKYIPTDNLYKFMTIFGLIIFGMSAIFPFTPIIKYSLERIKNLGETKILALELQFLQEDLDIFEDSFMSSTESDDVVDKVDNISKSKKEAIRRDFLDYQKENEENIEKFRLLRKKQLEIHNRNAINGVLRIQISLCRFLSFMGMIFGITLIFAGFPLWYYRLQIYEDEILKYRAEKGSRIEKARRE